MYFFELIVRVINLAMIEIKFYTDDITKSVPNKLKKGYTKNSQQQKW